jgi:hypothetical protein
MLADLGRSFLLEVHFLHLLAPGLGQTLGDQRRVLLVAVPCAVLLRRQAMRGQVFFGYDLEGLAAFQTRDASPLDGFLGVAELLTWFDFHAGHLFRDILDAVGNLHDHGPISSSVMLLTPACALKISRACFTNSSIVLFFCMHFELLLI